MTAATATNVRRILRPLLLSALLLGAALRAIGLPDLTAAADFLQNPYPTMAGAIAAVETVVWLLAAILIVFNVVAAIPPARSGMQLLRTRRQRALAVLAVGAMVLAMGVVRHVASKSDMCCGSLQEASQLVR